MHILPWDACMHSSISNMYSYGGYWVWMHKSGCIDSVHTAKYRMHKCRCCMHRPWWIQRVHKCLMHKNISFLHSHLPPESAGSAKSQYMRYLLVWLWIWAHPTWVRLSTLALEIFGQPRYVQVRTVYRYISFTSLSHGLFACAVNHHLTLTMTQHSHLQLSFWPLWPECPWRSQGLLVDQQKLALHQSQRLRRHWGSWRTLARLLKRFHT
jgi:hypothetical protein